MSSCAELRRGFALGLALAIGAASAAPDAADGSKGMVAPPRDGAPPAYNHRAGTEQPTLRCWQYGRLVFEKAGVRPAEIPAGAQVFRRSDRDDQPVYVYDMANGMCVVSHESTPQEAAGGSSR
jgi:hypothetical protein